MLCFGVIIVLIQWDFFLERRKYQISEVRPYDVSDLYISLESCSDRAGADAINISRLLV